MKARAFLIVLLAAIAFNAARAAPAPRVYADGEYTLDYVDEELGSVSVKATIKGGILASIEFPKGKGDIQLDDESLSAYVSALVAAPDYREVDAVSGATQSCDLLKYALLNALKPARLK